jgi:hypothetical protein
MIKYSISAALLDGSNFTDTILLNNNPVVLPVTAVVDNMNELPVLIK